MVVNRGRKTVTNRKTHELMTSIVDVFCSGYILHVFQGTLSPYDILLKYSSSKTKQPRTPKHIHWSVDLLLKKENDPVLTSEYLKLIKEVWIDSDVINDNSFETIDSLLNKLIKKYSLAKYESLNYYGEYPVEFLFVLMSLLAIQEKTNATHNGTTAVMFGKIIDELLKSDIDIFKLMSTAGFGGRK